MVTPAGHGQRLTRATLTRGRRQLIVVGPTFGDLPDALTANVRVASLGLEAVARPPLRVITSIAVAEIARQVGQPATRPRPSVSRAPRYDRQMKLVADGEMLLIEPELLLSF